MTKDEFLFLLKLSALADRWKSLAPLLIPQQAAIYEQCADELRASLKGE
ncbi:hypothetical protein [Pseudoxanthomonas winnipegensis]|nr:hypothetical protein [Pseudoxanthomonas winnipegensis]